MDEFQYQLYLNKIKSLKGTKQPLKDLALEINKISERADTLFDKIQIVYKKYLLFRNIEKYSAAVNPVSVTIEKWLSFYENSLVTSEHINIEQFKILYPHIKNKLTFFSMSCIRT